MSQPSARPQSRKMFMLGCPGDGKYWTIEASKRTSRNTIFSSWTNPYMGYINRHKNSFVSEGKFGEDRIPSKQDESVPAYLSEGQLLWWRWFCQSLECRRWSRIELKRQGLIDTQAKVSSLKSVNPDVDLWSRLTLIRIYFFRELRLHSDKSDIILRWGGRGW